MKTCPKCGCEFEESTSGLCPVCLLQSTLAEDDESFEVDPLSAVSADSFGNYKPVRVLGEGGMGVVFLAEQSGALRREVALKVLKTDLDSRAITARFERERQTLAKLDHPNIVTIFDAGMSTFHRPYFVMEVVKGAPITHYCDEHRLSINDRLRLFTQVCSALEHAHRHGVVHRDLKPSNVLVVDADSGPRVKVIDFGIAKLAAQESSRTLLTRRSQFAGTPGYMSPEQAGVIASPVGRQSDVYSLGAMLYELLCGLRTFDFQDAETIAPIAILKVLREDDPASLSHRVTAGAAALRNTDVRSLTRQLKGDLEAITSMALAKEPDQRYKSVNALAADLWHHLEHRPVSARRPRPAYSLGKWARRNRTALAVSLTLAVAATAVFLAASRRPREILAPRAQTPYTAMEGNEQNPTFSPDGRKVAFNWDGPDQDNVDIYVCSGPGEVPRRLTTDPLEDVSPSWSPDGKEIAFVRATPDRRGRLMVADPESGREQQLAQLNSPHGWFTTSLDWSPDGKWIVVLDRNPGDVQSGLHLISRSTGERHILTKPEINNEDMQPSFSRDGRRIAFVRDFGVGEAMWVLELTDRMEPAGPPRKLVLGGAFPAWFPNGDLLFESWRGSRHRFWRLRSNASEPELLPAFGDWMVQGVISRDGTKLVASKRVTDIDIVRYAMQPNGRMNGPLPFARTTVEEFAPKVSPDGKKVAFVSYRAGGYQLWMEDAEGHNLRRLSKEVGIEIITWDPNSEVLYFSSRNEGVKRRFRLDLRTGVQTPEPEHLVYVAFSPNGKWGYVHDETDAAPEFYRVPMDDPNGPNMIRLTPQTGYHPMLDPTGEWLYFVKVSTGKSPLLRIRAYGSGQLEVALPEVFAPYFVVTPIGIYFTKPQEPGSALDTLLLRKPDGRVAELVRLPAPLAKGQTFEASPDGKVVYLPFQVKHGTDLVLFDLK